MTEPLQIAICEDTKADEEKLLSILKECSIPNSATVFSSGEALLEAYIPRTYDLILSDIYMGGITGLEAVSRIRELDPDVPVAFITTSSDHALESYRLNALKYIEKPFRPMDIYNTLKLAKMERDTAPVLEFQNGGKSIRLRFAQILYLEQRIHQLELHLKDGTVMQFYEKLNDLMPQLDPDCFVHPHKSYAVNLDYIASIDTELRCYVLVNGVNIPIRREFMGQARKLLMDHLFQKARGGDT